MVSGEEPEIEKKHKQEEKEAFDYALKGELLETGRMGRLDELDAQNPKTEARRRKKQAAQDELLYLLLDLQRSFDEVMDKLNKELDQIREALALLESKMAENRLASDQAIARLDTIDELYDQIEHDPKAGIDAASSYLLSQGIPLPENATGAEIITLLEQTRSESLKSIGHLDERFYKLEDGHKQLKAREEEMLSLRDQIEALRADESLSSEEKLERLDTLQSGFATSSLHEVSNLLQDKEGISERLDQQFDRRAETDMKQSLQPLTL